MKHTKLLAVLLVVVLMLSMSSAAFADYPEKAIEVLIPAGPGGDTDTTVRAISASLTELLGQPVVVTNMPGGAGTVAMTELLNRDADGYTVFYHHVDTLLLELLKRMDDGWKWEDALDISAVTGGGNTYCIFVRKDNDKGIKTFEDLVNYAKENPYELTYAVEMGGTLHMHALALMQAMGIEVDCIDLGAASDRTIAFLGGQCDILEGLYSQGKEYIEMLPVMDYRNKSIPLEQVTSTDVNKAIQRSLTKACARHGLGLYIYAGEDLPDAAERPAPQPVQQTQSYYPRTSAPSWRRSPYNTNQ